MEHGTITLHTHSRRATEAAPPEPAVPVWQPAERSATDLPLPPDLESLGNQIAELSSRIDAATYELLRDLHEFDRRYGWEGFRSCAHWLNYRTGLALGAAREKLRVATALAELNHVSAAMARGQLSYSKVRALTRVATPATEAPLLAVALSSTAAQVERMVRAWRRADRDAAADGELDLLASRMLSMRVDEDGMVVVRGRLPAEVGAVLLRAVEAALEQVPAGEGGAAGESSAAADGETTIAQRRADALGLVAESALAGGLDPGNSADRFQVTVHVPVDALASRAPDGSAAPRNAAEPRAADPAVSQPFGPATADCVAPLGMERTGGVHSGEVTMPGKSSRAVLTPSDSPGRAGCNEANGHAGRCAERATPSPHAGKPARGSDAGRSDGSPGAGGGGGPAPTERATFAAAHAAAHVSAGTFEVSAGGGGLAARAAPDLDAGLAVIEQAGGLHLGREAARRLACDAGLVVLLGEGGGEVLDVGRRSRTVPSALRRALHSRDRGQCRFPGCESRHCDAHHVEHWADGGQTRLPNLVLLCRMHHRAVHEEGFRVVPAEVEGQFRFLRPDGAPVPDQPPPASWYGAPLAPTDARLAAAGIRIGPHTATPDWYGEPLRLQDALDVLWEPPAREQPAAAAVGVSMNRRGIAGPVPAVGYRRVAPRQDRR